MDVQYSNGRSDCPMPTLRIKDYCGAWRKCNISKIGYTYSGLSGKGKDDFGVGNAHYITFLNVLNNAEINTSQFEKVNVSSSEHQNKALKGDMFLNTSSETPEEVGMCSVLTKDQENLYLNSFCFGFRIRDNKTDTLFLAYLMRSRAGRNLMKILAQGATRYNLSKSNFLKSNLIIPNDNEEQIKIGNYFHHLDCQISNLSKELEKLRQLKAASLQAMFPQEGERAPRLRFKGFDGEWKFNTISSVLELRRGLTYTPNDMCDKNEGVLVLRSSNINGDTFHKDENDVYVRPAAVNIPLIKRGDLLFTAANGSSNLVGKHCIIPDIKTPAVPGGFMLVGKSENPYFLQAYFSAPWYQKALPSFIMGGNGSLGNLKVSDLLSHRLLFPEDTQEAEKIAIFFLNLDKQIKLTEKKLEKLRQIKASCLDLMFV